MLLTSTTIRDFVKDKIYLGLFVTPSEEPGIAALKAFSTDCLSIESSPMWMSLVLNQ